MHPSDSHSRRKFGFESLEAKVSPTAALVPTASVNVEPAAVEVAVFESRSASRLLQYVAMLEDIHIERTLPDQVDTNAIDRLIVESSPGS